jgi:hypothetical protein
LFIFLIFSITFKDIQIIFLFGYICLAISVGKLLITHQSTKNIFLYFSPGNIQGKDIDQIRGGRSGHL